jgi:hypothetical protein
MSGSIGRLVKCVRLQRAGYVVTWGDMKCIENSDGGNTGIT